MPRVARIHSWGGPDVIRVDDLPVPEPGPRDVRINVEAAALNRADAMRHNGEEGIKAALPEIPTPFGFECAGVVDAVGSDVTRFKPGDKVNACPHMETGYGTIGEVILWPEFVLSHYPEHLTPVEASAVWMQYMVAWGALVEHGKMQPEDFVLVSAASSSTGIGMIQLAKEAGATAIATTRTPEKKEFLLSVGADRVIATSEDDLVAEVMEITDGQGCRLICDPIGGDFMDTLIQCVAQWGYIFLYGFLSGQPTHIPLLGWPKGTMMMGYTASALIADPERRERGMAYVNERLNNDAFRPVIDRVFKLDEVVKAFQYLDGMSVLGKVVIVP